MTTDPGSPSDSMSQVAGRSSRRLFCTVVVAVAAATGFLAAVAWERLDERPMVRSASFTTSGWQDQWSPAQPNAFVQDEAGLRSAAAGGALLVHRVRSSAPATITYEASMQRDATPGDLSVIWFEQEGLGSEPLAAATAKGRQVRVQFGAFDNTMCLISDSLHRGQLARIHTRLETGRRYRFSVTLQPDSIVATIDGTEVMRCEPIIPLTSGHFVLYGHYAGKTFHQAQVTTHPTNRPTPSMGGDLLLAAGHNLDASAAYGVQSELTADDATREVLLFRKGLAEHLAGRQSLARRSWSRLRDPALLQRAEVLGLEQPALPQTRTAFATLWRIGDAELRRLLVQRWQTWLHGQLSPQLSAPAGSIDDLLALRAEWFADDTVSGEDAARALNALHRHEEVVAGFTPYTIERFFAYLALGRAQEILDGDWALSYQRIHARFVTGDIEPIVSLQTATPHQRAMALCKLDRAEEASRLTPDRHPGLLHAGRAADLLALPGLPPAVIGEAMLAVGRGGELAGSTDTTLHSTPAHTTALLLHGRIDEAERSAGRPFPGVRLIAAMESGDPAAVIAAADAVLAAHPHLDRRRITAENWFSFAILVPVARWQVAGDRSSLEQGLKQSATLLRGNLARRPEAFVEALTGATDHSREACNQLPFVSERDGWQALAAAMRADLAGERVAARSAYEAFESMPLHRRLLAESLPNVEVERYVAWRRRELSRPAGR